MDKELFNKQFLEKAKEIALVLYKDRAIDKDRPDLFVTKCYLMSFVQVLNNKGYVINKVENK